MWPAYPTLRTDDIDFKALVALLLDDTSPSWPATPPTSRDHHRSSASATSATPSRSSGPGSARTVSRSSSTTRSVRAASTCAASGSPAKQVRQFAFRDSDSTLTAVWVERYGAWTAERLMARQKDRASTASRRRRPPRRRRPSGPSSACEPASRELEAGQPGRLRRRSSPRRSTPSASPSATSSRRGGRRERHRRPPGLAPGRAAGPRRGRLAARPRGAGPDRRPLPCGRHDARRLRPRLDAASRSR